MGSERGRSRSSAPGSPGAYLNTYAKMSPAVIIAVTMMTTASGSAVTDS